MSAEPTPRITFVYSYSDDLSAVRAFYEGLLGLRVSGDTDAFVEFSAGIRLVFSKYSGDAPSPPAEAAFSSFPGWSGGNAQRALCSIECTKPQLDAIRDRLNASGVNFTEMELRDGAWELRVLDPMGNTVELYAIEKG